MGVGVKEETELLLMTLEEALGVGDGEAEDERLELALDDTVELDEGASELDMMEELGEALELGVALELIFDEGEGVGVGVEETGVEIDEERTEDDGDGDGVEELKLELTAAFWYRFNRFPAPQYSVLLPAHSMLQSVAA